MRLLVGIGLFAVALLFTGAKAASSLLDKISWSWQPIRLSDIRILKSEIFLGLVILNRSTLDLPLERFTGTISRKGVQLATFGSNNIISLPPGQQKLLQLIVKVDSEVFFNHLASEIEQGSKMVEPFEIQGLMYIKGVGLPFYEKKQLII